MTDNQEHAPSDAGHRNEEEQVAGCCLAMTAFTVLSLLGVGIGWINYGLGGGMVGLAVAIVASILAFVGISEGGSR